MKRAEEQLYSVPLPVASVMLRPSGPKPVPSISKLEPVQQYVDRPSGRYGQPVGQGQHGRQGME